MPSLADLRQTLRANTLADEEGVIRRLLAEATLDTDVRQAIAKRACGSGPSHSRQVEQGPDGDLSGRIRVVDRRGCCPDAPCRSAASGARCRNRRCPDRRQACTGRLGLPFWQILITARQLGNTRSGYDQRRARRLGAGDDGRSAWSGQAPRRTGDPGCGDPGDARDGAPVRAGANDHRSDETRLWPRGKRVYLFL